MFKKLSLTAMTVLALGAQLASPFTAFAESAFKLGGNFETSGPHAAYGTPMKKAFELYLKQYNEQGGFEGKEVEWVVYDNKSDITESASVASRLVSDGVVGVVGPGTTGSVLAEAPVLDQAKIPHVLPAASGDGLTLDSQGDVLEYLYRVCFEDSYQGAAGGQFAATELGKTKAAVLEDSGNDFAKGIAASFKEAFEKNGGEVVVNESFAEGDQDFSAIISTLLSNDVDVIYFAGYYTEGGMFIKQAREMGLDQPIVSGDGFTSPTLVELSGGMADDIYYTSGFSEKLESEKLDAFLKSYKEEYGEDADQFAALSFDATGLLVDAIERAGSTDPEAVTKALNETKDFEGVTGKFSIDELHNPQKPVLVLEMQQGEVVKATPVEVN
ncbi:ABC transporter substrate-binding protein [Dolosicoccus paucivorans]|uniref:Branched-chain amino acid ABC transporter substrate-binding protein n=1 Tax=Dolosicoccus paucivorans TaxID=84521 RepID=A0A1G8IJS5_9LACT|nr:ABC transporter substrate-binding protein [Dolosicoccus paucivorans]PMB84949.1 branched-chain amino acid ABC transporter substrate-binding protein [Dolosicoccus paucivorans]PMC58720.1 branched-chain amino acid ABC transporter substrate-binding protein [Dolosicoccus paucivorans]SDI19031.1 branched-chain amino acid transport system substrate-binding protein [Dolosicoccus paucivorans]